MMPALRTSDADTLATIDEMVAANLAVLGDRLVGVCVYGSLVTGDFDPVVSDIDLIAVLTDALDVGDYDPLRAAYAGVTAAHPRWHNRVELAYIPRAELRTYRADATGSPAMSRRSGTSATAPTRCSRCAVAPTRRHTAAP